MGFFNPDSDGVIIDPVPLRDPILLRAGLPFNYDSNAASEASGVSFPEGSSMAQQQFAEEVDINTIVRRFGLTGELPELPRPPQSGDFCDVHDFQSAMNAVTAAREGFMEFPAELRARFANDPQRMLEFLKNPDNREEALKLGILPKPPEVTRDVVTAVDDLAAKIVPPTPK